MRKFSNEDRRRRLIARHKLGADLRCERVEEVVDSLLAIHSSDPASVFLSIATRMSEPSIELIEQALHVERSLVRHHAFRRTLWVMAPDTARAAHASATAKIAAVERRTLLRMIVEAPSIDAKTTEQAERWCLAALDQVRAFTRDHGPTTTREIGRRFPELTLPLTLGAGTKHAGEAAAHTRVLQLAGFEADLIRTRPVNGWNTAEYAWTDAAEWLGSPLTGAPVRESAALILSAWLRRFGPATEVDIKWWTGWTAAQTRTALADIDAEHVRLDADQTGWIAAGDFDVPDVGTSMALLPGLDATTMGWKDRRWYLPAHVADRVFDRWSNAGPTIWRNGEIIGGWAQRADGSVAVELSAALRVSEQRMLDDEIDRFAQLVGETRVRLRFPSRNQAALLATEAVTG